MHRPGIRSGLPVQDTLIGAGDFLSFTSAIQRSAKVTERKSVGMAKAEKPRAIKLKQMIYCGC